MRHVVGGVGALLVQAMTTALDVAHLSLDAAALAGIGADVAAGQADLQGHHAQALRTLLQGLQKVNGDVRRVADAYTDVDRDVADGFGRTDAGGVTHSTYQATAPAGAAPTAPAGGLLAGLWGSGVGGTVADRALRDVGDGEPTSVANVVRYLGDAGVGRVDATPLPADAFHGPTSFADWLDSDADHQTHVGVIHVYRGDVRDLADIPGGVRRGDVVVVDPDAIGVATADTGGRGGAAALVNHGALDPALGHRGAVRVYRPL